jgi:pimeloyl-ACP methyl ester carboxylesterase
VAEPHCAIVEKGAGPALVLIPGIQGRWEYSRAIVDELARSYRVITFSLRDERRKGSTTCRMDVFADQVEDALDRLAVERAFIVGVSFGGLVGLRFAATRPARTRALAMLSAPGPQWHLRPRHDVYARLPWVFGPLFLVESPFRLRDEVKAALPNPSDRRRHALDMLRTLVSAPVSPARLAARARLIGSYDRVSDCASVNSPTLVMLGDEHLDHVTGSGGTERYATLIPHARLVRVHGTGHLGSVTRARECAAIIHEFLRDAEKDTHHSAA